MNTLGDNVDWIVTFGSNHLGGTGNHKYVIIRTESEIMARAIANVAFDMGWSMIYSSKEEAGVDKWNLKLYRVFELMEY
jgi:hypothetical protein